MAWVSGGVQAGSLSEPGGVGPPRPSTIPAHYVFDEQSELWMPPSAVKEKEREGAETGVVKKDLGGGAQITVFKSSASNPSPYGQGHEGEPICFEYTNSGSCRCAQRAGGEASLGWAVACALLLGAGVVEGWVVGGMMGFDEAEQVVCLEYCSVVGWVVQLSR